MGDPGAKHSSSQAPIEIGSLSPELQAAFRQLEAHLGRPIVPLHWNGNYVGAAFDIRVDLPSRGPVDGIDIRLSEPVLLLLHKRRYPFEAPLAHSDRRDFPAERLPHINPTKPGLPPWLCLHRGSLDDWFAEHSLADYIERVRAWYRDAARGRLIRATDRFEATRIVDSNRSLIVARAKLDALARESWAVDRARGGASYAAAVLTFDTVRDTGHSGDMAVQYEWFAPSVPAEVADVFRKWNALPNEVQRFRLRTFGVVAWGPYLPASRYCAHLPTSFAELREFTAEHGIDIEGAVHASHQAGATLLASIPISIAIVRPTPLIGSASEIEWISFTIRAPDQGWPEHLSDAGSAAVTPLVQREPLTPALAQELSNTSGVDRLTRPVLLGCGALGSKIALSVARSGAAKWVFVDYAAMSPHHLVRHGLGTGWNGRSKADALRDEVAAMYLQSAESLGVVSLQTTVAEALASACDQLTSASLVLDATASRSVFNTLVDTAALDDRQICRCEIADDGRLGIMMFEGKGRNPRLDDLQVELFARALVDDSVSEWLLRNRAETEGLRAAALEEIELGLGCSSVTMRLADDVVALHASRMSHALRTLVVDAAGLVQISTCSVESNADVGVQRIPVPPVMAQVASNSSGWCVRMSQDAWNEIRAHASRSRRSETGGLLVGWVQRRRRTIYVARALAPSRDSKGTPFYFLRGTRDYPDTLDRIEERSGQLLGYVGEWHTHPDGRLAPSSTDLSAVRDIVRHLRPAGIPAHILIADAARWASYVFDAEPQRTYGAA